MTKKRQKILDSYDKLAIFPLEKALDLVLSGSSYNFDESVDLVVNLNLDTRHADQQIKSSVVMPNGTGRKVVVAVFAKGDKALEAQKAGADIVGDDDLVSDIKSGVINFDRCISTPDLMSKVGSLGKVLGPKGLMPNPKLGTVTMNVAEAVEDFRKGKVEFKADKYGIVHASIGRKSFSRESLKENILCFMSSILSSKPSGAKGSYLKSILLCSTMGFSYRVLVSDLV